MQLSELNLLTVKLPTIEIIMKKQNFNLVEIIIAMGIVVVCITTIMGMFSVGMKISKDATIKTYANIVFEQLGGFVETYPGAKDEVPTIACNAVTQGDGAVNRYPNNATDAGKIKKPTNGTFSTNNWTSNLNIKDAEDYCDSSENGQAIDTQDPFFKNVYYDSTRSSGEKFSLLKIEFQTTVNSSNVKDAVIWARLWFETDATATAIQTTKDGPITIDEKLYIELTWPEKIPYNNRVLSGQIIQKEWVMEP